MLTIEIRINERLIARARAANVSGLAPSSNYACIAISEASTLTGAPFRRHEFDIAGHERVQTAWALVRKIAEEIEARETAPVEQGVK